MPFDRLEDLRPVMIVQGQKAASTVLSGVLDRGDWEYPEAVTFITWAGAVMAGATSGMKLVVKSSNTVSATASGMTNITSANTSGLTYTNSGQCIALAVDLRGAARFVGVTLSVPVTSADTGVIALCSKHPDFPPAAVTGSQSRFVGQ